LKWDEIAEKHYDTLDKEPFDQLLIAAEVLGRDSRLYLQKSEAITERVLKVLETNLEEGSKSAIAKDWARKLDKEISGLNIQINLIGVELVEGTKERILKEFKGLEKYLYISKRIPKNEVEIVMANSDALIVLQGMNNIIDSKVYDYLPFQKPIILCSNTNHLLISLLNDTKLGVVAKDEKELYDNLKDLYYKKQNNIPLLNDVNLTEIKKYSREAQTAKLANIIKNL
jgi:hypothetical protein